MGKLGSPGESCASGEPSGRGAPRKRAVVALSGQSPLREGLGALFSSGAAERHHPTCPSPQSEGG